MFVTLGAQTGHVMLSAVAYQGGARGRRWHSSQFLSQAICALPAEQVH